MSLFTAEQNHRHGGDCRRHAGSVITMVFIAAAAITIAAAPALLVLMLLSVRGIVGVGLIIIAALLGVGERLVGLGDLNEDAVRTLALAALLRLPALRVLVWVMLDRELVVGFLDFPVSCFPFDTQHLIVVALLLRRNLQHQNRPKQEVCGRQAESPNPPPGTCNRHNHTLSLPQLAVTHFPSPTFIHSCETGLWICRTLPALPCC